MAGGGGGEPEDAVHLVVRGETAVGRLGRPVADLLGAAADEVVEGGQDRPGDGAVARLLLDLAERAA